MPATAAQPDHLGTLGLAVACLLPALPAGWKAAGLRGDIFQKWAERVDVAHAGLTERAKDELLNLQAEIANALGGPGRSFSPAEVIADPVPLVDGAKRCADILRARDKLHARFRRHRRLGRLLLGVVAVYVLGWIVATLHYSDVVYPTWVGITGIAVAGSAVFAGVLVFIVYATCESQLARAEELSAGESA
ncbi:MAG: hypothetical protein JWO74_1594 [Solirubrobacterales bacterium]|nr:hypothetical protein [Solirubrobacterales bacterium]